MVLRFPRDARLPCPCSWVPAVGPLVQRRLSSVRWLFCAAPSAGTSRAARTPASRVRRSGPGRWRATASSRRPSATSSRSSTKTCARSSSRWALPRHGRAFIITVSRVSRSQIYFASFFCGFWFSSPSPARAGSLDSRSPQCARASRSVTVRSRSIPLPLPSYPRWATSNDTRYEPKEPAGPHSPRASLLSRIGGRRGAPRGRCTPALAGSTDAARSTSRCRPRSRA